jgi:hypothetical protein
VSGCEAVVEFNKNSLIEWSDYYQKIFFLMLHKFLIIYPAVKKEDAGRLALRFIRNEFAHLRAEINNPHLNELLKMRSRKAN